MDKKKNLFLIVKLFRKDYITRFKKAIAGMTKRLWQDKIAKNLDALLSCRLIPLGKLTGVRPTGIRKVLGHIIRKIVMKPPRRDVLSTTDH